MSLGLSFTEKDAYSSNQGWSGIFIGDKISAKLRKCQQIVWIAHRYTNHAPPRRYQVAHKLCLLFIQVGVHRRNNEYIGFSSCLQWLLPAISSITRENRQYAHIGMI